MQMETGLDTGPVRASVRTPVAGKTAGELTVELAGLGAELIVKVLADLPAFPPVAQPEEGLTYASKIDKAEAKLDFTAPADQVLRQILAFNPAPGAFFEAEGERYKVLAAEIAQGSGNPGTTLDDALTIACGQHAIRPTLIQRAGKPAMPTADLLRGRPFPAGSQLS
jgi:methionyl-tRNA formyltransferase